MTKLRFLNYFIICCFFMPFFQLCSGCENSPVPFLEKTTSINSLNKDTTNVDTTSTFESLKATNIQNIKTSPYSNINRFSSNLVETYISPLLFTDNFTASGAGILYVFIACTLETSIPPAHPLILLTIASFTLLVLITLKIQKGKINQAKRFSTFLTISNLLLFISALIFLDNFTDIRWGFYLFLLASFILNRHLKHKTLRSITSYSVDNQIIFTKSNNK